MLVQGRLLHESTLRNLPNFSDVVIDKFNAYVKRKLTVILFYSYFSIFIGFLVSTVLAPCVMATVS